MLHSKRALEHSQKRLKNTKHEGEVLWIQVFQNVILGV